MITCFDNLIGVRGLCGDTTPDSGLYIDDLQYLDRKTLDAIIDSEISGQQLFENKVRYAAATIVNTIQQRSAPNFLPRTLLANQITGFYNPPAQFNAPAALLQGIELRIESRENVELQLNRIRLFTQTTGNIPVKVYNLITGQLLDTITIAATANTISEATAFKTYPTDKQRLYLFIGYDTTEITSYQSIVASDAGQLGGCFDCWYNCGNLNMAYARAVNFGIDEQMYRENANGITNTAGLSLDFNVACSQQGFICNQRQNLAFPFLHLVGALLCEEGLNNKRVNSITTVDREKLEKCRDFCNTQYADSMANFMQNMVYPADGICFKCNKPVQRATLIP